MASGIKGIADGRSDLFRVDPRKLNIKPNWNNRDMSDPDNKAHIQMLKLSISEEGVREPLTVYWENNKAWVSDGHCRLIATMEAIKAGVDIKTVPVKTEDRHSNEADRLFSQVLRNSGKPFTAMENAKVFKKLIALGWTQKLIAEKSGLSGPRVSQILDLNKLPEPVKQMVAEGKVSAHMAAETFKAEGADTTQVLREGIEVAAAEGKTRVTPSHVQNSETSKKKRASIKSLFESAYIDNSDDEKVVVTFKHNDFEIVKKTLKLKL